MQAVQQVALLPEAKVTPIKRRRRTSTAEEEVAIVLDVLGVEYAREQSVDHNQWRFDFVFPGLGILLDLHGCYFHACLSCPYGASRALTDKHRDGIRRHTNDDRRKAEYARRWLAPAWTYKILWEHDVYGMRGPGRGKRVSGGLCFKVEEALGPRWALISRL